MCTVTLAPVSQSEQGFVLTSNRDEVVLRDTLLPAFYVENGLKMLYPRDARAGGTWIGISERKRAICLLNGGGAKHKPNPPYRKSRGLVVKEFLGFVDITQGMAEYNYSGIEPFTAIIVDWGKELEFRELVWDGKKSYFKELPLDCYIWSSVLLYSPEEIQRRERMFEIFKKESACTPEKLFAFHSSEGDDSEEGLIINRGFLKTCSIAQIFKREGAERMLYRDLLKELETEYVFN